MASQAYVFVYVAPGTADGVAKAMARHREVKAAHAYWGWPDVIAFAETASLRAPSDLVLPHIQRVRGERRWTAESCSTCEPHRERSRAGETVVGPRPGSPPRRAGEGLVREKEEDHG